MISQSVLFDSTIVIDALLGRSAAAELLDAHADRAISVVTWIEVLTGSPEGEIANTRRFLRAFTRVDLTEAVADEAAALRRRHRLRLPDAVILASAALHGRVLLTRDAKDFERLGRPDVVVPYRL